MAPHDALLPQTLTLAGAGGLSLAADAFGDPSAPPVLLLHGGGQTRHAWSDTARRLAQRGWRALALDLRGHGDSAWSPGGDYSLDGFAEDVRAVASSCAAPPVIIGASLGGIAGLVAVGEGRAPASALVLVDIALQLEPRGVERILQFMRAYPDGFASLDEAAEAVAAYLPHREKPRDHRGLQKNLRRSSEGRLRWHWDPRVIAEEARPHLGRQAARLDAAARALALPVLLVRGRQSDILSQEGVEHFRSTVPHAHFADVSGAGHMIVGDNNDAFSAALFSFLDAVSSSFSDNHRRL